MAITVITGAGATHHQIGGTVTVQAAKKIKLNRKTVTIYVGNTVRLKLSGAKASKVSWKSSNKKVAKVSKGTVTALTAGTAKITAKYNKKSYKCTVTVQDASLTGQLSLKVGEDYSLTVMNTTGKVAWKSSNLGVATVNSKGLVSAVSAGTAAIKATVGHTTYTCNVTVTAPLTGADFELDFYGKQYKGYLNYYDATTGMPGWYCYFNDPSERYICNRNLAPGDSLDDVVKTFGYSEPQAVPANDIYSQYFSSLDYPTRYMKFDYYDASSKRQYSKLFYFDRNDILVAIIWQVQFPDGNVY